MLGTYDYQIGFAKGGAPIPKFPYGESSDRLRELIDPEELKKWEARSPALVKEVLAAYERHEPIHSRAGANYGALSTSTFRKKPILAPEYAPDTDRLKLSIDAAQQRVKNNTDRLADYQANMEKIERDYGNSIAWEQEGGWHGEFGRHNSPKQMYENYQRWTEQCKRQLVLAERSAQVMQMPGMSVDDPAIQSFLVNKVGDKPIRDPNKIPKWLDRRGQPVAGLVELYRNMRGIAHIDEAGNLITSSEGLLGTIPNGFGTKLNKLIMEGIVHHDQRTHTYVIPAATMKKIDPYYKEYNSTIAQLLKHPGQSYIRSKIEEALETWKTKHKALNEDPRFWTVILADDSPFKNNDDSEKVIAAKKRRETEQPPEGYSPDVRYADFVRELDALETAQSRAKDAAFAHDDFMNKDEYLAYHRHNNNEPIPYEETVTRENRRKLGYIFGLRGLKNLQKSGNLGGALLEIKRFMEDQYENYRTAPATARVDVDSMNTLRTRQQVIAAANARRNLKLNMRELVENHPEYADMPEEELIKLLSGPYKYSKDITDAVSQHAPEWKLIVDEADMYARGNKLLHCYATIPSYHRDYHQRVITGKTLLLGHEADPLAHRLTGKPQVTAELDLELADPDQIRRMNADLLRDYAIEKKRTNNPNLPEPEMYRAGTILKVSIPQIQAYRNDSDYRRQSKVPPEILALQKALVGKNIRDLNIELTDNGEKDIMERLFKGGYVTDSFADGGIVIDAHTEEEKLLKRATSLQGTPNIENVLLAEAKADLMGDAEAKQVVAKVMERLTHVGEGRPSNALGKGHLPQDRLNAIKSMLKNR